MTMLEPGAARVRDRARGRRRERRGRAVAWILRLVVLLVVFLAGVVIGKAVEQAPEPGGTQTRVRTLEPETVPPAERTVTITTTAP